MNDWMRAGPASRPCHLRERKDARSSPLDRMATATSQSPRAFLIFCFLISLRSFIFVVAVTMTSPDESCLQVFFTSNLRTLNVFLTDIAQPFRFIYFLVWNGSETPGFKKRLCDFGKLKLARYFPASKDDITAKTRDKSS